MKTIKLLFFSMLCLMAVAGQAQRCAVLEFKAGVGISQNDVDGISAIFITYFQPAGYTMVERTQIDKVIEEQGFQRSNMTQSQMVRVGQILNVSKIVVGDINVVQGQYNVDARVINVETGTIAATEGATFSTSSYRANMQNVAQKLAGKIAITPGSTVSATTQTQTQTQTTPYVIYGYLKVFPNDLGNFDSEPRQVIARLNQSQQYGYGTWRLPTNEELALMRANNVVGNGSYMTQENRKGKGTVRLVTDKEKGEVLPSVPQGYVDLGLPSGTIWKDKNESGFYDYDEAVRLFGSEIPTKEQFEELKDVCTWSWTGSGYKVTGPNGKSITLPAAGYRGAGEIEYSKGNVGSYWSSTLKGYSTSGQYKRIYELWFGCSGVDISDSQSNNGKTVRLVQD